MPAVASLVACVPFSCHIIFSIPCSPGNIQVVEEAGAPHYSYGKRDFKTFSENSAPQRFRHLESFECERCNLTRHSIVHAAVSHNS